MSRVFKMVVFRSLRIWVPAAENLVLVCLSLMEEATYTGRGLAALFGGMKVPNHPIPDSVKHGHLFPPR